MRILALFLLALTLYAKELVVVSIEPQRYFVQQIAKDLVDVEVLVPHGSSPATYAIKPSQLRALKEAKLYFTIGVPFEEHYLDRIKASAPHLKIIDSGRYVKRFFLSHDGQTHPDPHIWLAPPYVMSIARVVTEELCKIDPNHATNYLQNYQTFIQNLAKIDSEIFTQLLPLKKRSFIVYHPSFGYFAKVYGLRQIAIEHEGKSPRAKELEKLIKRAKKEGITTIFIEPQFPRRSAELLARKIGAKIEVIDPLAPDWEANIKRIADAISHQDH